MEVTFFSVHMTTIATCYHPDHS